MGPPGRVPVFALSTETVQFALKSVIHEIHRIVLVESDTNKKTSVPISPICFTID